MPASPRRRWRTPVRKAPDVLSTTAQIYANWGQRVGAYLIDSVPVVVIVIIGVATRSIALAFLFDLAALAVSGYNRWFQAGATGQSWGKRH